MAGGAAPAQQRREQQNHLMQRSLRDLHPPARHQRFGCPEREGMRTHHHGASATTRSRVDAEQRRERLRHGPHNRLVPQLRRRAAQHNRGRARRGLPPRHRRVAPHRIDGALRASAAGAGSLGSARVCVRRLCRAVEPGAQQRHQPAVQSTPAHDTVAPLQILSRVWGGALLAHGADVAIRVVAEQLALRRVVANDRRHGTYRPAPQTPRLLRLQTGQRGASRTGHRPRGRCPAQSRAWPGRRPPPPSPR